MSTVTATLSYFTPPSDGSKPYTDINGDIKSGTGQNWKAEDQRLEIENIRGKESEFSLDVAGFQIVRREAKHKAFNTDNEIAREYYPESIEFVKDITGASDVIIFDHTIRRRRPDVIDNGPDKRQPVPRVHVDQTPKSAVNRVHKHVPTSTDATKRLQRRFQIINLWRPISHPADDWPLAFCDYRSVDPDRDFFPTDLKYPDWTGETMSVKFNESHKWKYVRGMTPEEFVLIKCFDSKDGVAKFVPHTGFEDPTTPKDAPFRESIELRCLVFYD